MTLNFRLQKDVTQINFGIGFDIETKNLMIALLYWCFSITSIKLKNHANNIEVVEPIKL